MGFKAWSSDRRESWPGVAGGGRDYEVAATVGRSFWRLGSGRIRLSMSKGVKKAEKLKTEKLNASFRSRGCSAKKRAPPYIRGG
jgi:hypothetical protein